MQQVQKRHAPSIFEELERVVGNGSSENRVNIMRRVTDLFLTAPASLTDEQVTLFDDVINRLIGRLESQSLAELSVRLGQSSHAPPAVLRRLASDESIDVAGPVLARSSCLTDEALVEIAQSKSQLHLSKIAERGELSPAVTDVLVDRGNQDVVKKVAANSGARFSNLGMSTLALRADGDDELIETISRRTDVPSVVFSQLLSYATDQTRARLLAARPENEIIINQVLSQISGNASRLATLAKDWAATQRFMHSFGQDTDLTRTKVLEFADGGRITELLAALSALSGIQTNLIGRLICDRVGFGLTVLCKAVGLDWSVTHAVLKAGPNADEHAKRLEEYCTDFERLSVSTACRVLAFWQGQLKAKGTFEAALGSRSQDYDSL